MQPQRSSEVRERTFPFPWGGLRDCPPPPIAGCSTRPILSARTLDRGSNGSQKNGHITCWKGGLGRERQWWAWGCMPPQHRPQNGLVWGWKPRWRFHRHHHVRTRSCRKFPPCTFNGNKWQQSMPALLTGKPPLSHSLSDLRDDISMSTGKDPTGKATWRTPAPNKGCSRSPSLYTDLNTFQDSRKSRWWQKGRLLGPGKSELMDTFYVADPGFTKWQNVFGDHPQDPAHETENKEMRTLFLQTNDFSFAGSFLFNFLFICLLILFISLIAFVWFFSPFNIAQGLVHTSTSSSSLLSKQPVQSLRTKLPFNLKLRVSCVCFLLLFGSSSNKICFFEKQT